MGQIGSKPARLRHFWTRQKIWLGTPTVQTVARIRAVGKIGPFFTHERLGSCPKCPAGT